MRYFGNDVHHNAAVTVISHVEKWHFTVELLYIVQFVTVGSNPGGGEIFRTCADRSWVPPSLLYSGYRVFPGGKERPGHDPDPHPF